MNKTMDVNLYIGHVWNGSLHKSSRLHVGSVCMATIGATPAFDRKTIAGAAARHFLGRVYLSTVELISIQVTVEVPGICVFSWKAAEEGRLRRQSDPALEDGKLRDGWILAFKQQNIVLWIVSSKWVHDFS